MKLFVTGATGFVGNAFLQHLPSAGIDVYCLVRKKVSLLPDSFEQIVGGFSDYHSQEIEQKLKMASLNTAVLMGWEGLPDYSLEMCLKNLHDQLCWIKLLARVGCKKIILTGSCWQYGKQEGEVKLGYDPREVNLFGAIKNSLHQISLAVAREFGTQIIDARIFFVYGTGQKPQSLLPTVVRSLQSGGRPDIRTPNSANDFIHVDDVAGALVTLATHNGTESGVYDLGSGKPTTVKEMVNTASKCLDLPLLYDTDYQVNGFWANNQRLRKLGWAPSISLEEGIKKFILSS